MFADGTTTLVPFAGAYANFVSYLKRLLPHMQKSLQEESELPGCFSELQSANAAVSSAFVGIANKFQGLGVNIAVLGGQDANAGAKGFEANVVAAVESLGGLQAAFEELSSSFSSKLKLEGQLQRPAHLKSTDTDSMINQALGKIATTFRSLVTTMDQHKSTLVMGASYAVRGVPSVALAASGTSQPSAVKVLESRATNFMR